MANAPSPNWPAPPTDMEGTRRIIQRLRLALQPALILFILEIFAWLAAIWRI